MTPSGPPVAALPADIFPAIPGRPTGLTTDVDATASDGQTMVMAITRRGRVAVPQLRYSSDGGLTWTDGMLTERAEREVAIEEAWLGAAAVASTGNVRTWLVLSSKDEAAFAWTSSDARTWDRTPATGLDLRTTTVNSVTGLEGGGFVAVGQRETGTDYQPLAWTSPDGIAWTAHSVKGTGRLDEVAARGRTLVAVGARDLPVTKAGRSRYPLLVTSTDGVTWSPAKLAEPRDSASFVTSLSAVVATKGGFMVGGAYYSDTESTYRPWTLSSTDGKRWKQGPWLVTGGDAGDVADLIQVGERTVVVRSSTAGSREYLNVLSGDGATTWRTVRTDASKLALTYLGGVAAQGRATLVVRNEANAERITTELWSLDESDELATTDLTEPPDSRPVSEPSGLVLIEGAVAVYGSNQGASVLWKRDGAGFTAPQILLDKPRQSVDTVVWDKRAGFLASGEKNGDALVLTSADGRTWRRTEPSAFNKVGQYHVSWVNGALRARNRWIVVGGRSTNGSVRQSALVFTSPDGRRWVAGTPTRVLARGDYYGRDDPLDDLHGLENSSRWMVAVTAQGTRLVAVGGILVKSVTRPAAWVSGDASRWRLVTLPSGGYERARLADVEATGDVLVASGWVWPKDADSGYPAVWRSTDHGRTWQFHALATEPAQTIHLTRSAREFLVLTVGRDSRTVTLWRSADGRSWRSDPVPVTGLADGMEVSVTDILAENSNLHVLLSLRDRWSAVSLLQAVPLG